MKGELAEPDSMEVLPFIQSGHAFYPHVDRFRRLMAGHPRYRELVPAIVSQPTAEVRTLIRGRPGAGRWDLKGLYRSFQCRDESRPLGFHAVTFLYSVSRGLLSCNEFPHDPYLPAAAAFFDERRRRQVDDRADRVLRYVPLRRLTFRTSAGDGARVIGKFVRPSEVGPAYDRLGTVFETVSRSSCRFRVAAPKGSDERQHLFFQEARPGGRLTQFLGPDSASDLLRVVGALHRELHALDVPGLPGRDVNAFIQTITDHLECIAVFRPEDAPVLDDVLAVLRARAPGVSPRDYRFCHGDFRCSQILKEDDRWSVIDFDGCLRADPYLEVAYLVAFLKYDVPLFARWFEEGQDDRLEEAYEAYLSGYEAGAPHALDRARLLWYRIGGEIHCLARMIRRDLIRSVAWSRGLDLLRHLSERLRREATEPA
jgi:thiamine kinase-like enzyme